MNLVGTNFVMKRRVALTVLVLVTAAWLGGFVVLNRANSRIPHVEDIEFLEAHALTSYNEIQIAESWIGMTKRISRSPQRIYVFDMPLEDVEALLRTELDSKKGWLLKSNSASVVPNCSAVNYKLPKTVRVDVRQSGRRALAVVQYSQWVDVSSAESQFLQYLWKLQGEDIKSGT